MDDENSPSPLPELKLFDIKPVHPKTEIIPQVPVATLGASLLFSEWCNLGGQLSCRWVWTKEPSLSLAGMGAGGWPGRLVLLVSHPGAVRSYTSLLCFALQAGLQLKARVVQSRTERLGAFIKQNYFHSWSCSTVAHSDLNCIFCRPDKQDTHRLHLPLHLSSSCFEFKGHK